MDDSDLIDLKRAQNRRGRVLKVLHGSFVDDASCDQFQDSFVDEDEVIEDGKLSSSLSARRKKLSTKITNGISQFSLSSASTAWQSGEMSNYGGAGRRESDHSSRSSFLQKSFLSTSSFEEDITLRKRVAGFVFGYEGSNGNIVHTRPRSRRHHHDEGGNSETIPSPRASRAQPRAPPPPSRPGAFQSGGENGYRGVEQIKGQLTPMRENKERPSIVNNDYDQNVGDLDLDANKDGGDENDPSKQGPPLLVASTTYASSTASFDESNDADIFHGLMSRELEKNGCCSGSRTLWAIIIVVLVIAVAGGLFATGVMGPRNRQHTNNPGHFPSPDIDKSIRLGKEAIEFVENVNQQCISSSPTNLTIDTLSPAAREWLLDRVDIPFQMFNLTVESNVLDCSPQNMALLTIATSPDKELAHNFERYILLLLYYTTEGHGWHFLWSRDDLRIRNHCNWHGIRCSPVRGKRQAPTPIQSVKLDANNLKNQLPIELTLLTDLRQLFVQSNALSGTLPTQLGQLTKLKTMDFSLNRLTGEIPTEIGNMADLAKCNLFQNSLNGTIPTEVIRLLSLESLVLFRNQLTGVAIPSGIDLLTRLTSLAIGSNNFQAASIPSELWKLSKLETINLIGSNLYGTIPTTELLNTTHLTHLGLSENDLKGTLSSHIGSLRRLEDFRMNGNQLIGTIPSQIGECTLLTTLAMSQNQLTGTIPSGAFDKLTRLAFLDLQGNPNLVGSLDGFCDRKLEASGIYYVDKRIDCYCCPEV